MRTFTIILLFLLVFTFAGQYLYKHSEIVTNAVSKVMNRFCDSWTECDDKGSRIENDEPITNEPYEKPQY